MDALKPQHKRAFNKAVNWLIKHNEFDRQRNEIDGEFGDDSNQYERINRKCESSFDKYLDACDELPKYEVKRIENSDLY